MVEEGEHFTPLAARDGWDGSVHRWCQTLREEPRIKMLELRSGFNIPFPLGGRRLVLVPASYESYFRIFQALLAILFPTVVWETDIATLAPAGERAGLCRALDTHDPSAVRLDAHGRPTAASVNAKRALCALAAFRRDDYAAVLSVFTETGVGIEHVTETAAAAGTSESRSVTTPRRLPSNPCCVLPRDPEISRAAAVDPTPA